MRYEYINTCKLIFNIQFTHPVPNPPLVSPQASPTKQAAAHRSSSRAADAAAAVAAAGALAAGGRFNCSTAAAEYW